MSASPEFYKPAAPAAFSSPCASPLPVPPGFAGFRADNDGGGYSYYSCRTPTGSGITYLKEPTTCPPAPRKPPAPLCKKRLFHSQQGEAEVPLISVRLDELERIFRPHQPPPPNLADKRRRSGSATAEDKSSSTTTTTTLDTN